MSELDKELDPNKGTVIPGEKEPYIPKDKWEEKALASGKWKPLEQWEGDPEDWRPAREYVERGDLFNKIESQKQELKQMRKVLDTLKDHHLRVKQEAMEDAIAILKKQRDEAKRNEDVTKVIEITEEIDGLKDKQQKEIKKAQAELQAAEGAPVSGEPSTTFKQWHEVNGWYKLNSRDAMSTYANAEAERYLQEHRGQVSEADLLEYVTEAVKKEFSDKFKKHDPKVEGGGGTRPSGKGSSKYVLSEEEKRIGETLVKNKVLTWDQYIKDLQSYDEGRS